MTGRLQVYVCATYFLGSGVAIYTFVEKKYTKAELDGNDKQPSEQGSGRASHQDEMWRAPFGATH
jgi:hypothetical protein